jgi:hypothetical protein
LGKAKNITKTLSWDELPSQGSITGGNLWITFHAYQDVPLNVTYRGLKPTNITLVVSNTPEHSWIGFVPSHVISNAGPGVHQTTMRLAGAGMVVSGVPGPGHPLIQAVDGAGNVIAECSFYTFADEQVSTVNSLVAPSVSFPVAGSHSNSYYFEIFGVVYDTSSFTPQEQTQNSTADVSISILGLVQNGTIIPMPSWLNITTPDPTFVLNASEPYWGDMHMVFGNAQLGTYNVAIGETFNQRYSVIVDLTFKITGTCFDSPCG